MKLSRTGMRSIRVTWQLSRYSTWNRKKTTLFSGHYLRKLSTLDVGVLGYIGILNIRNTLPKFGTFLLGHPVYTHIHKQNASATARAQVLSVSSSGRKKYIKGYSENYSLILSIWRGQDNYSDTLSKSVEFLEWIRIHIYKFHFWIAWQNFNFSILILILL
jgi:hypothetical protein